MKSGLCRRRKIQNRAQIILAEIKDAIAKLDRPTIDDVNRVSKEITDRWNHEARIDFCGLSPADMIRVLSFPFDSPELIEFPTVIAQPAIESRIATLFPLLISKIGEKGIKTTVTGNLPLSIVRPLADEAMPADELEMWTRHGKLRTESEFRDLHITRILGGMSGMLRKATGRLFVTKACRQLLARSGMSEIYPRLFRVYATKLNWGYLDHGAELNSIQDSFAFTLYLLTKFGDEWRPPSFYEDAYLRAFPQVLDRLEDRLYSTVEQQFRSAYTHRALLRFACLLGLIETQEEKTGFLTKTVGIRKSALLGEVVRFRGLARS